MNQGNDLNATYNAKPFSQNISKYLFRVNLLRGHPDAMPSPLERTLDNVNLSTNIKGHFFSAKGVASQQPLDNNMSVLCLYTVFGITFKYGSTIKCHCFK